MNIFILDDDPKIAAQMHCDKHLIKMILESVQILCSVFHKKTPHLSPPYKLTHANHPVCVFANASQGNFEWLLDHSRALCEEYTKRYKKIHKSQEVLNWCIDNKEELYFFFKDLQPFVVAIAADKECRKQVPNFDKLSAVEQYRLYYVFDKTFAKWKYSETPEWYLNMKKQHNLSICSQTNK